MTQQARDFLTFLIALLATVVFALLASWCFAISPAQAADLICAAVALPDKPAEIDASDGSITFCSPFLDDDGNPWPEDATMVCSIEVDGELVFVSDPIVPRTAFAYSDATLTFEHEVQAWCTSTGGDGERLADQPVTAMFRPLRLGDRTWCRQPDWVLIENSAGWSRVACP
jgi:hypothetical protein